jgi:small-conductance mechanosensitive channel
MERVWVEGFTHLLAVLGLVSAGLVVTNKETIMNFVGWLVITWRGLFSEDDLIQIQQYKGYVKRIGMLYVMLYEVSDSSGNISGRVIRIPNGLVSNNPIINFSQTTHLFEQSFTLLFSSDNDFMALKEKIKTVVDNVLAETYKGKQEFSVNYLSKHNKQLPSRIRLGAKVTLQSKSENLSTIQLITRYYCFSRDAEKIQETILLALLTVIKNEESIKLG